MTYKLSPSTLNLYLECPRCFYMSIKEKIWRPRGPFPSIASGIDRIAKLRFDEFRNKNKTPPEIKQIGYKLFMNSELLEEWRDNKRGLKWTDKNENTLMGAIDDLIIDKKGVFTVLDYKTKGFEFKRDPLLDHPQYKFQMESYAFIFKANGFKVNEYAYLLFFIPKGLKKEGLIEYENKFLGFKLDLKKPELLFQEAIAFLEGNRPQLNPRCEYCKRDKKIIDEIF